VIFFLWGELGRLPARQLPRTYLGVPNHQEYGVDFTPLGVAQLVPGDQRMIRAPLNLLGVLTAKEEQTTMNMTILANL
jgi:hypothetical protein